MAKSPLLFYRHGKASLFFRHCEESATKQSGRWIRVISFTVPLSTPTPQSSHQPEIIPKNLKSRTAFPMSVWRTRPRVRSWLEVEDSRPRLPNGHIAAWLAPTSVIARPSSSSSVIIYNCRTPVRFDPNRIRLPDGKMFLVVFYYPVPSISSFPIPIAVRFPYVLRCRQWLASDKPMCSHGRT